MRRPSVFTPILGGPGYLNDLGDCVERRDPEQPLHRGAYGHAGPLRIGRDDREPAGPRRDGRPDRARLTTGGNDVDLERRDRRGRLAGAPGLPAGGPLQAGMVRMTLTTNDVV